MKKIRITFYCSRLTPQDILESCRTLLEVLDNTENIEVLIPNKLTVDKFV